MIRHSLTIAWAVAVLLLLAGCDEPPGTGTRAIGGSEQARVTSPNGQLDAVLLREDGGGAPGGWEWYVYIVPRGSQEIPEKAQPVFNAGTLIDGTLVWSGEHLLDIHYKIAGINQFRNLWGLDEIQNVGPTGERDYLVEIRLAPASRDYSLLTPNGTFKPRN